MPKVRFEIEDVRPLLEHSLNAESHSGGYGGTTGPGLIIVGDRGLYLMSTGQPMLPNPDGSEGHRVAYAEGCDPNKDEDYYENKQHAFGGDDGAEYLPMDASYLDSFDKSDYIEVLLTEESISLSLVKRG